MKDSYTEASFLSLSAQLSGKFLCDPKKKGLPGLRVPTWSLIERAMKEGKTVMYLGLETTKETFIERMEKLLCLRK